MPNSSCDTCLFPSSSSMEWPSVSLLSYLYIPISAFQQSISYVSTMLTLFVAVFLYTPPYSQSRFPGPLTGYVLPFLILCRNTQPPRSTSLFQNLLNFMIWVSLLTLGNNRSRWRHPFFTPVRTHHSYAQSSKRCTRWLRDDSAPKTTSSFYSKILAITQISCDPESCLQRCHTVQIALSIPVHDPCTMSQIPFENAEGVPFSL